MCFRADCSSFNSPSSAQFEMLEPRRMLSSVPPQIVSVVADNRGWVQMQASVELNPASLNANSVSIFTTGPDGRFGTADDVKQPAQVFYTPGTRLIDIRSSLPANTPYRIHLNSQLVTSTTGVQLDGEFYGQGTRSGDGAPGGDFDISTRAPAERLARIWTYAGNIDVRLFNQQTPATVQNFTHYANSGRYDNTFFHRSVPSFVIQGGGFKAADGFASTRDTVRAPVMNEPGISNVRGTIAMAKLGGEPNSATNEWFFNLGNNSANLDAQNGGFTVFGEITNASGRAIMDALANLPTVDATSVYPQRPFGELPIRDVDKVVQQQDVLPNDLATVNRVALLQDFAPTNPWRAGAIADFDGNGTADILWRNYATGANVLWVMNGNQRSGSVAFPSLANKQWELAAAADFDKNGHLDLLWRNRVTGQNTLWLMNGAQIQSFKAIPPVANLNFKIAGVGDFNNDGNVDILWRNYQNGLNSLWLMNGTNVSQFRAIPPVANLNFAIAGVADLNDDGRADVIWRNTVTGQNTTWLMNGQNIGAFRALPGRVNMNYVLAGAGNFNGDNSLDLVWLNYRNRAGEVWLMDGPQYASTVQLPTLPG